MEIYKEAVLVGIYCTFLLVLLQTWIKNPELLFFTVGFCKHFLGAILQIHTWYCKNVENHKIYVTKMDLLMAESVLEGIYFMVLGKLYKPNILFIFCLGSMTHIIAEYIGVHRIFCNVHSKIDL